jgi:hypothetical protein
MSTFGTFISGLILCSSLVGGLQAADTKVDSEGFVRDWLLLAPFPVPEDSGADEIAKAQIATEGELKPKAGDKQKIGDKEATWKAAIAKEYYIDINEVLGSRHENVLAYLVAYVVAEQDMPGLVMGVGSNDQCKVWLNGKEVHKATEPRAIEQDSDLVQGVALKKGVNTIVFKVINQQNDWAAAVRFLKEGKGVTGLVVKSEP